MGGSLLLHTSSIKARSSCGPMPLYLVCTSKHVQIIELGLINASCTCTYENKMIKCVRIEVTVRLKYLKSNAA